MCAVVILFNPGRSLVDRLMAISEQVDQIILVDNGSNPGTLAVLRQAIEKRRITLIENFENVGVAAALNQGIRKAQDEEFEWVLTLDQDS